MPSVGDEVYILWEMRLEASPGTVLEVPVRLTMNGVVLPTPSPTYWIDPTLTFTAQSRDPYLVVPGIQTAKVELDPQNLISETTEADNVRWYAWESQGAVQDIGITSVTLSPSSLPVPLHGDSVVLNVVLTGSGIPLAGMITLIAVLDDYSTEVFCGSLDISGSTFSGGTATVSVNCTTENARVCIAYLPVVRVTVSGFVDSVTTNNEGYGDHYIIPQSMPPGNVRIISGSLPLAEVNIYTTSGGYVTTAWPLSDGTVFLNLSVGTYLMAVETAIGAPLFDANGYPAFAIAANPTSDTAPAVSLDKARYNCPSGYCIQMTVGSQSSFFGRLMIMASVAMAATSSAEEQAKRDRVAWEARYIMGGCVGGDHPKTGCPGLKGYQFDKENQVFSEFSYLSKDVGALKKVFGALGSPSTCYLHPYDRCYDEKGNRSYCWCKDCKSEKGCVSCQPYTCFVQYDPTTQTDQYSQSETQNDINKTDYPMGVARGGQCKAFVNLLLYRSGVYQGPAPTYAFKQLPTDPTIKGDLRLFPPVDDKNLREGSVLRRPDGLIHALIVLARLPGPTPDNPNLLVIDSNYLDPTGNRKGDGHEVIGTHIMPLRDPDGIKSDLNGYRNLDCVYADPPCEA